MLQSLSLLTWNYCDLLKVGYFNNFKVAGFANFLDYEHLIGKLTGVS